MKKYSFTLISFIIVLSACNKPKEPVFKKLNQVRVNALKKSETMVSANAVYENPNDFGGTLVYTDLDVYLDDIKIARIKQKEDIKIEPNSDFSIPLSIIIDREKLKKENKGWLKSALKQIGSEGANLRFDGYFTVELLSADIDIPMEYTEKVKLFGF